jgi:hypothetical protein
VRDAAVLTPLELPGREAPDVDVEFVQPWVAAVTAELDLEFELVTGYGLVADGAWRANARPAPGAIRSATWELATLHCLTGLRAEKSFVRHLQYLGTDRTTARAMHMRKAKPDAGGVPRPGASVGNPEDGKFHANPGGRGANEPCLTTAPVAVPGLVAGAGARAPAGARLR